MNYQELKEQIKQYRQERLLKGHSKNQIVALREEFTKEATECIKCGRKEMLTLDHIIPISLLLQLGFDELEDNDENWQVLCRPCNQYKQNRLDFTNLKTKTLLIKYIEKL